MNALFLIAIYGLVWALNIYLYIDVVEFRYKMVKLLVDNLIQGQQGKLWAQENKGKQQLSLQFRITSF